MSWTTNDLKQVGTATWQQSQQTAAFHPSARNLPVSFRPLAVERIDYGKGQRGAADLSTGLRYRFGFGASGPRAHGPPWHGSDI